MRITVDGVDYVPATSQKIGVGITTRNRPDQLSATLAAFEKFSPGIPVVVVDDGSDAPAFGADLVVRHSKSLGIAQAKNRCLSELMALGVEHLFLFDDDTRPSRPDWWMPFVESKESHLQHSWTHFANGKPVEKMSVIFEDSDVVAYSWSMGCLLYLTRAVVDTVGGMRPEFGPAMHEHIEYSRRIHSAGLSTFPFQDIPNSSELISAGDRSQSVKSSITVPDRRQLLARNDQLLEQFSGSADHVPYGHRNMVLTCLLTAHPDPQRPKPMRPDPALAAALLKSLADIDAVVICDFPTDKPGFEQVTTATNPYIQRWISFRKYLIAHPEIRFVWCVDATDVECLRDPFAMMQPGTLYCGWENQVVGCPWMIEHHAASRDWINANADKTLLNAGVVGGDRATMLTFTERLLAFWIDSGGQDLADMGFFNRAAYSMNPCYGPRITTLFKSNSPTDWSLWRHK